MDRRNFLRTASAAGLATGASVAAQPASAQEVFNWRMPCLYPRGASHGLVYGEFAERLKAVSGGRLDLSVIYDGEGVSATEILQATSTGLVEAGLPYMALHSGELPSGVVELGIPGGPTNLQDLMSLIYQGWYPVLKEAYATLNLEYLGPIFYPGVHIITTKPLTSIKDLQGMKLRAPGAYGKFVANLGAQPVTMAFSETYSALATGVIDGCCSSTLVDYRDGRFYEFAKYFHPVAVTPSQVTQLVVNRDAWATLSPELQTITETTNVWHGVQHAVRGNAWTKEAVAEMQAGGMEWNTPFGDEDMAIWKNAANALAPEYAQSDEFSKQLIEIQTAFMN
ncbi:TRAP transporter substrate-binding protein DctP [Lentibacter algarum]|uniref:TRAP transporter substrate-binding protein DctP n=1 Tax=Lentibacter algarum TaxID=576131 RepID=UPI003BAF84A7